MRRICETCGSQGWKGLLVTCSKCRIACEHRYCMVKPSFETSIDFICADCSMRIAQNSFAPKLTKAVPRSHHHKNKARVESSNPVPRWKKIPETSKMKLISPEEARKLAYGGSGTTKSTFKVPRPLPPRPTMSLIKKPRARVVSPKTYPILLPPKKVETRRPQHTLQIRSGGIRRQAYKDVVSNEICHSILSEKLLQLLPYRPALRPTWRGRIVDSATPSEFNGVFWAQPASEIRVKAYKLSKAIPVLLKVKLVPIGNRLNDLFANRKPTLSDIEMYIFPDDKSMKKSKEEHAYLFEAMKTRNAMMRMKINDTPLLIFSSKLLDKSSQIIIKMQKKTDKFLWGIFLVSEKSLALLPGTSSQTA